jgi:sulfoxide reductase heme-binding subunit YedZ
MSATALNTHLFWITSRAAGSLALILASLSVGLGLLMAGKLLKGRTPDLRVLHEALALGTIAALVVHAGALLFDGFIGMSVVDVTVPFVSAYHRFWTSLGIIGGWAIVLLGLSFYVRDRIGRNRWKLLHRFTALGWLLGAGHSLGEGTDAGQWWFLASMALVFLPALALLVGRWTVRRPSTPQRALRPL